MVTDPPDHHAWLSPLEEELLRAREQERQGKARLDEQEKRVAHLKAAKLPMRQSERLLETMREAHKIQTSHVQLLEREIAQGYDLTHPSKVKTSVTRRSCSPVK